MAKLQELSKNKWSDGKNIYYFKECCGVCGKAFIGKKQSQYCTLKCFGKRYVTEKTREKIRRKSKGRKLSKEAKRKISEKAKLRVGNLNHFYGKHHTEETKKKISETRKGKGPKKSNYTLNKLPLYDTYASQLEWCEEVRRSPTDRNILEVRCTYCGKWMIPNVNLTYNRIQALNGIYRGEQKFYCSNDCKKVCPIYGKTPDQLMKEDAIRAGRLGWLELNREVQPELRKLVLERDGYQCIKCGLEGPLHCHHIFPVAVEPIESADIGNCITLCIDCHKKVHKKEGCRYGELRMEICY